MEKTTQFPTIRQAAATGIVTENALRTWLRQGKLPGFYTGNRYHVNYELLLRQLDAESAANCGGGAE